MFNADVSVVDPDDAIKAAPEYNVTVSRLPAGNRSDAYEPNSLHAAGTVVVVRGEYEDVMRYLVDYLGMTDPEADIAIYERRKHDHHVLGEHAADLCPMCGTDHQDPNSTCDYEECGYCGFDHEYEPEAAKAWHEKNDPTGSIYEVQDLDLDDRDDIEPWEQEHTGFDPIELPQTMSVDDEGDDFYAKSATSSREDFHADDGLGSFDESKMINVTLGELKMLIKEAASQAMADIRTYVAKWNLQLFTNKQEIADQFLVDVSDLPPGIQAAAMFADYDMVCAAVVVKDKLFRFGSEELGEDPGDLIPVTLDELDQLGDPTDWAER